MLRFVGPSLVKRFTHTHSKTIFPENNNKVIENLIKEQNEILKQMRKEISVITLVIAFLSATIAFKPMK